MTKKWKKLWAAAPKNSNHEVYISDYKMTYDKRFDNWYPNIGVISNIFGISFEDGLLMIDADWEEKK